MEDIGLEQAISNLEGIADSPEAARGCRVSLISFVWLDTLLHHWPSRGTPVLQALRVRFDFLKTEEKSRYLKQRRIILKKLVRRLVPA
jgi:hypothetical protein